LAHYLWPPRWVDVPDWKKGPTPESLGDVIVEAELPGGVRARAFRDGMIAFVLGGLAPSYQDDFSQWFGIGVRLMNAHLACLHTALGPGLPFKTAVVTPWTTMQVTFETGSFAAMTDASSGGTLLALHKARTASLIGADDWRFQRWSSVALNGESVRRSFELLHDLLDRPASERDRGLLRAELLLRARAAQLDVDYTGALTNAWTAMEGLLGDLLGRYLDENEDRPAIKDASGNSVKFIDGKRRKFFEGAEMTVRHVVEMLSLLDLLPFPVYRAARRGARARNDWLHKERPPSEQDAAAVLSASGELFEMVEGVPLKVA